MPSCADIDLSFDDCGTSRVNAASEWDWDSAATVSQVCPRLRKNPRLLASSTTTSAPLVAAYAAIVFSAGPKMRVHV